jgi:hypothetical protein
MIDLKDDLAYLEYWTNENIRDAKMISSKTKSLYYREKEWIPFLLWDIISKLECLKECVNSEKNKGSVKNEHN